jgi:hypothetical protein
MAMLGFGCMAWLLASAVGLAMLVFSCMAWLWLWLLALVQLAVVWKLEMLAVSNFS